MCNVKKRAILRSDTGGSVKCQSRLGRSASVRGGAPCAPGARAAAAAAAAARRDAATPKPARLSAEITSPLHAASAHTAHSRMPHHTSHRSSAPTDHR
ncbi:hypothetical protein JYU34_016458 [Plutella xylostella]|uniref:Uncharacterized protein n=1 Tax=Plutella xylostella TaxID=51655 RepID=A0ABQ7Q2R0_PLUXY|nr:hypothetical protein JYU34_016458 [Plutella xylostella]